MSITKSMSYALRKYKAANHLSMTALAAELGIAVSSLEGYMNGTANPRAETIEMIAKKMNVSMIEMVSGPAPEWRRAETIVRTARELGDLPSELQEEGIYHFLALVTLFARDI